MRIRELIFLLVLAVGLSSCGAYEKLLKSNDFEAQYRGALDYYKAKKDNKAIALFDAVESIFSQTEKEDTIKFYKAKSIYRTGDFETSAMLFDDFRKNFGRSPFLEESEYLYAMSYYYMSPLVELDQTNTVRAIASIEEYLERYPNSPKADVSRKLIDELYKKLEEKAFLSAKIYFDIRYYNSAILAFKNALKKYPDSPYREDILYLIMRSSFLYARNSVASKQKSRFLDMLDAYYNFVSEYPESKYKKEAAKMYDYTQRFLKAEESGEITDKKGAKDFDRRERRAFEKEVRAEQERNHVKKAETPVPEDKQK